MGRPVGPFDVTGLAAAGNADPAGVALFGATVLVSDAMDGKAYAYDLITARRLSDMEADFGSDVGTAAGIWADSATLWAADTDTATEVDSFRRPQPADGAPDVWNAQMDPDSDTEVATPYNGSTGNYTITPTTTGTHTLKIVGRNWGRHQRFATGNYTITITANT